MEKEDLPQARVRHHGDAQFLVATATKARKLGALALHGLRGRSVVKRSEQRAQVFSVSADFDRECALRRSGGEERERQHHPVELLEQRADFLLGGRKIFLF